MHVVFSGVDPGLVHTGIVTVHLWYATRRFHVEAYPQLAVTTTAGDIMLPGTARAVATQLMNDQAEVVYIEKYEPRSHFDTDERMTGLVRELARTIPHSRIVSNTGSKQVLTPKLLRLLHLHSFPATHHRDLEAAARIAVFGALKDEVLNERLYMFVEDHLDGRPWRYI